MKTSNENKFAFYFSHQQNYFALQTWRWWNPKKDTKTKHSGQVLYTMCSVQTDF